jgi:hypothetical protein
VRNLASLVPQMGRPTHRRGASRESVPVLFGISRPPRSV